MPVIVRWQSDSQDNCRHRRCVPAGYRFESPLNLEISMTGFSPTNILIEPGTLNINAGIIYLDEGGVLDELMVSGNSVHNVKGGVIVYPLPAYVRASATAIGLFKMFPGSFR